MEREHLTGTIQVWPGVAEELVGAKAYMVQAGLLKDVGTYDLFTHVASNFGVSYGPGADRTAWSQSSTCLKARVLTPPVRHGAVRAPSMPWS